MTEYGARMERGICRSASEGGAVIESLDRPGIVTPQLKRADGSAPAAGENVWFWMSDDGSGMIGGGASASDSIRAITDDEIDEICTYP